MVRLKREHAFERSDGCFHIIKRRSRYAVVVERVHAVWLELQRRTEYVARARGIAQCQQGHPEVRAGRDRRRIKIDRAPISRRSSGEAAAFPQCIGQAPM